MTRSVAGAPAASSAVATACMRWRLAAQLRWTALAPTTARAPRTRRAAPTNTRAADVRVPAPASGGEPAHRQRRCPRARARSLRGEGDGRVDERAAGDVDRGHDRAEREQQHGVAEERPEQRTRRRRQAPMTMNGTNTNAATRIEKMNAAATRPPTRVSSSGPIPIPSRWSSVAGIVMLFHSLMSRMNSTLPEDVDGESGPNTASWRAYQGATTRRTGRRSRRRRRAGSAAAPASRRTPRDPSGPTGPSRRARPAPARRRCATGWRRRRAARRATKSRGLPRRPRPASHSEPATSGW